MRAVGLAEGDNFWGGYMDDTPPTGVVGTTPATGNVISGNYVILIPLGFLPESLTAVHFGLFTLGEILSGCFHSCGHRGKLRQFTILVCSLRRFERGLFSREHSGREFAR
jgi:hypothetical protein